MAKKFFALLQEHEIKKTKDVHDNLCFFLCIDKKYKNYLMLKKLRRCIMDFNQSPYFQSIGLKKQKLEDAPAAAPGEGGEAAKDEEYEYYDEEDPNADENKEEYGDEYYDEEGDYGEEAGAKLGKVPLPPGQPAVEAAAAAAGGQAKAPGD